MATPILGTGDVQPRAVADLLDGMVQATIETDRELASILITARNSLQALAWHRWGQRTSAASMRQRFSHRHKAIREGASDA